MVDIICGAQACGFGPVSKLISVIAYLQDKTNLLASKHVCFLGQGTALDYVFKNKKYFNDIHNQSQVSDIVQHELVSQSKLAIIVMDHQLAFLCHSRKIPYIFIDSLIGFWIIDNSEILWKSLNAGDISEDIFSSFSVHERKLIAHFYSYKSYVLNFLKVEDRINFLRTKGFKNLILSRPLWNRKPMLTSSEISSSQKTVLINLGGIGNFLINADDSVYVKLINDLIFGMVSKGKFSQFDKIIVCAGSFKTTESHYINGVQIILTFLSKDDFFSELMSCQLYLLSPGLTSIMESIELGKPFFLLPEQHFSQYYNLHKIREVYGIQNSISLLDIIRDVAIPQSDSSGSKKILQMLKDILKEKELYKKVELLFIERIKEFNAKISILQTSHKMFEGVDLFESIRNDISNLLILKESKCS